MIRICSYLIFILILIGVDTSVAQNRTYFNKAKNEKLQSITYSKSLLNNLKSSNENQLDKLALASEQLKKQREVLNIVNREIQLINDEIKLDENKIKNLNTELESLKKEYAKLLYFAYLNIGLQNRMIYIMSANNFNQAYKRIVYLKQLSEFRKSRFTKIESSLKAIDSGLVELKKLKSEKDLLVGEKSSQVDSLEKLKGNLHQIISSTSSQISSISEQIKIDDDKKVVIKETVTKEIAIENKNKEYAISNKSDKLEGNITEKFSNNKKWHIWPLQKFVVLHHFGDYYHPELKDIIVKNDGIELGASAGSYVHSIYQGKVMSIVPIPGFGVSIIIKHGNYYSVYSNVEGVKVKKGDVVERAQVIAKLGNNKVNKMNFQLWMGKSNTNPEKLNPELWLKKQ